MTDPHFTEENPYWGNHPTWSPAHSIAPEEWGCLRADPNHWFSFGCEYSSHVIHLPIYTPSWNGTVQTKLCVYLEPVREVAEA